MLRVQIPADVREAMTAELSGEFTTPEGSAERDAEIEARIEAGNRIYLGHVAGVLRTAHAELVAAGMSPATAALMVGYDPDLHGPLDPVDGEGVTGRGSR